MTMRQALSLLPPMLLAVACTPSGASCPEPSTLTYANFGRGFMDRYCTRCHAADVRGDERHGAPSDANFDTHGGVRAARSAIDALAAAGPHASNDAMPPSGVGTEGPTPLPEERRMLGEWLACGAR
jgi:hypothetical protein